MFVSTQNTVHGCAKPSRRGKLTAVAAAPAGLGSAVRDFQATKEASAPAVTNGPAVTAVPGTEILPPPPPEVPAAPSQGMDFVLEQLAAKEAPAPVPPAAPAAPSLPVPSFDFDLKAATSALTPPSDLADGAAAAASKASAAAADAAGAVSGAVDATLKEATSAASAVASQLTGQVGGLTSTAGSALERAQKEASATAESLQSTITSSIAGVQASASEAVSSVTTVVQSQVAGVVDQLPPPVKDALAAATSAANDALSFVAHDPKLVGPAAAVGVGVPVLLAWNAAYGGYAGPFSAQKALEVLQTQDAVLVDVRSERQRLDSGVPELKRGARGKGITLTPSQLLPSVSRRVRNPNDLALEIFGAQVASLARLGGGTRVIIMDDRGEVAKAVARSATAAGLRRVHIVEGGFRAWKAAGLSLVEGASEYDSNPLAVVGDAAESVAEEAATLLRTPSAVAALAGEGILAALLAYNYHAVFQFIGVLGLEATIALRVIEYDSPQDALDDINALLGTVTTVAKAPVALIERVAGTVQQAQQQQQQQPPAQQSLPQENQ